MLISSVLWGSSATSALLIIFVASIRLFSGRWTQVYEQAADIGVFIALLAIGFGVQIALWRNLRLRHAQRMKTHGVPAVSGATSTVAMLACCSHYFVNILPFLGLIGIAGFLTAYQNQIMVASIGINLLGIAYMVYLIQKHRAVWVGEACD